MGNVLVLRVNELLVLGVDEWGEERNGGREKSEAPAGQKLDEVVADESCYECL